MLADTLKELRKKNYLNQTAFANKIGVTQSAVSQWENGLTRPNFDQLKSISAAFNISVDDLLSGEEPIEPVPQESPEITIVSGMMAKMTKQQQDQVVAVIRAMFPDNQ